MGIPGGTKFSRVPIFVFFAIFPAISSKNKFPQIKITVNIFPAKIRYNFLSFRNKTVYNKILVLHRVRFENTYFYCTYLIKTKIISMLGTSRSFSLGTGYFLKIEKINSQKKNQSVLIAKISSRKHKKSPIRKIKLPQNFRATRYRNHVHSRALRERITGDSKGFSRTARFARPNGELARRLLLRKLSIQHFSPSVVWE